MGNTYTTEMIFRKFGRHLLASVLLLSGFTAFSTLTVFTLMLFFLHLITGVNFFFPTLVGKNRIL